MGTARFPEDIHPFLEFLEGSDETGKMGKHRGAEFKGPLQITLLSHCYWCHFVCTQIIRLRLCSRGTRRSRCGRERGLSTVDQFSTVCDVIMVYGRCQERIHLQFREAVAPVRRPFCWSEEHASLYKMLQNLYWR